MIPGFVFFWWARVIHRNPQPQPWWQKPAWIATR